MDKLRFFFHKNERNIQKRERTGYIYRGILTLCCSISFKIWSLNLAHSSDVRVSAFAITGMMLTLLWSLDMNSTSRGFNPWPEKSWLKLFHGEKQTLWPEKLWLKLFHGEKQTLWPEKLWLKLFQREKQTLWPEKLWLKLFQREKLCGCSEYCENTDAPMPQNVSEDIEEDVIGRRT